MKYEYPELDGIFKYSDKERNKFLLGEFKIDKRINDLTEKLGEYYKQTENINGKLAHKKHREFMSWAENSGYTREEINAAKKQRFSCR